MGTGAPALRTLLGIVLCTSSSGCSPVPFTINGNTKWSALLSSLSFWQTLKTEGFMGTLEFVVGRSVG